MTASVRAAAKTTPHHFGAARARAFPLALPFPRRPPISLCPRPLCVLSVTGCLASVSPPPPPRRRLGTARARRRLRRAAP
eukprot:195506-Prymnesium_polylepis.1